MATASCREAEERSQRRAAAIRHVLESIRTGHNSTFFVRYIEACLVLLWNEGVLKHIHHIFVHNCLLSFTMNKCGSFFAFVCRIAPPLPERHWPPWLIWAVQTSTALFFNITQLYTSDILRCCRAYNTLSYNGYVSTLGKPPFVRMYRWIIMFHVPGQWQKVIWRTGRTVVLSNLNGKGTHLPGTIMKYRMEK